MDENKPRRRWLSFGIRDLLWAMVVVGLVIVVMLQRIQAGLMKSELHSERVWFNLLEEEFVRAGGEVHRDEYGNISGFVTPVSKTPVFRNRAND